MNLRVAFHTCLDCIMNFRADEEPVDQKRYLEDSCKPKCVKPLLEYQVCFFEAYNYILDHLILKSNYRLAL